MCIVYFSTFRFWNRSLARICSMYGAFGILSRVIHVLQPGKTKRSESFFLFSFAFRVKCSYNLYVFDLFDCELCAFYSFYGIFTVFGGGTWIPFMFIFVLLLFLHPFHCSSALSLLPICRRNSFSASRNKCEQSFSCLFIKKKKKNCFFHCSDSFRLIKYFILLLA